MISWLPELHLRPERPLRYHRTDDAESTNTLNGDGTITSDWSEGWSETWDPQGGSGSGSGSSSGSSSSGSYSGSETSEDPVDNSFAENRQTEPAPVTGNGVMLNAAAILEMLGRPGADAVRAAGNNPETPEETEEPIHEGGPLDGGGRWEYYQQGTYWWYGEFDAEENLVYEVQGDMANKNAWTVLYDAAEEARQAEETAKKGTERAKETTNVGEDSEGEQTIADKYPRVAGLTYSQIRQRQRALKTAKRAMKLRWTRDYMEREGIDQVALGKEIDEELAEIDAYLNDPEAVKFARQIQKFKEALANAMRKFDPSRIPKKRIDEMVDKGLAFRETRNGRTLVIIPLLDSNGEPASYLVLEEYAETTTHRHVQNYGGDLPPRTFYTSQTRQYYAVIAQDNEAEAFDGVKGVFKTAFSWPGRAQMSREMALATVLTFALHLLPTGAGLDYARQGETGEAIISFIGDGLLFAGAFAKAANMGRKFQKGAHIANIVGEGGIALYRAGEGIGKLIDGDTMGAAGNAGEVILRLFGVAFSARELKALQTQVATSGGRKWIWEYGKISDDHAEAAYQVIRDSTTDVAAISRYTGYKSERLQKIKEYLFNNAEWTHADADIAAAWHRLRTGRGTATDRLLLKHETVEIWLRRVKGLSYEEAHRLANDKFNWQKIIEGESE